MKYLVTGASGFIGPHLIRRLVSKGHSCRCLIRGNSDTRLIENIDGAEKFIGDITDPKTLTGIAHGMDGVFHLATLGHMSNYTVTEQMFESININGTINIMNEALRSGVPKVVHCSSVAAMGICPDAVADENTPCNPHHPYGRSKLKAEKEVLNLVAQKGLPAVITRFSMVYGPGDRRDILRLVRLTKKGLFPKIGKRPKLTPLIHVEDAVDGLLLAAEKGRIGEIYLLTNKQPVPFDDIRKIIASALGIKRPTVYIPEWAALLAADISERVFSLIGKAPPIARKNIESTLADRVFSMEKARIELDFEPKIDAYQGLKETVLWYKENGWI